MFSPMGKLPTHEGEGRRKPLRAAFAREVHAKKRDIMNFMNFVGGCRSCRPLEFTAGHATSGPE
jgi:hypothetical protein